MNGPVNPYLERVANIKGQLSRSMAGRVGGFVKQVNEVNSTSCVVPSMSGQYKSHLVLLYESRKNLG